MREQTRFGIRSAALLFALVSGAAVSGPTGYDARWSCGANELPSARAKAPFAIDFKLFAEDGRLTGRIDGRQTVEQIDGSISANGPTTVRLRGQWRDAPERTWNTILSGMTEERGGTLDGSMFAGESATAIRTCSLVLRKSSTPNPIESQRVSSMLRAESSAIVAAELLVATPETGISAPARGRTQQQAVADTGLKSWLGSAKPIAIDRAEFLRAAKQGELAGLGNVTDPSDDGKTVVATVAYILAHDYKTPIPDDRRVGNCVATVPFNIVRAVAGLTRARIQTLSSSPPEFRLRAEVSPANIENELRGIEGHCASRTLGQDKPYLFVASLRQLLSDYDAATQSYVDAKREALIASFQKGQEAKRAAAAADIAARRGAEQERINAERKRIEEQERPAKPRDTNRVAG